MAASTIDLRRNVIGGAVGNVMEWYDFAAYAYMAPILGKLFFPSEDAFASLIAAFGAFAAGYVSRPLGAILFGHIGDKIGRKPMLLLSVLMMGLATTAIGLLPVEADIGWVAAAALVALRLVQGISVGGEYGGSLTFIAEHAPPKRRGFAISFVLVGSNLGFLIGAGIAALVTQSFSDAELGSWAWRVPFLLGGVIALIALWLRRSLSEPPLPPDHEPLAESPVIIAFRDHWRDMLKVGGLYLTVNAGFYLIFVYVVSYLTTVMHMPRDTAMDINIACIFIMCVLPIGFAMLSDRIGRKPMLIAGGIGVIVLTYPLFMLIDNSAVLPVLLGQIGFAVLFSWIYGANPAAQTEVAPRHVRATVLTMSTNIAMAVFGGTMPMVAAYLVHRTHDDFAPAYYLMGLGVLSLIAVLTTREMAGKPLP